jgi:hypothetical protein
LRGNTGEFRWRMQGYEVVASEDVDILAQRVDAWLERGWMLQGGVARGLLAAFRAGGGAQFRPLTAYPAPGARRAPGRLGGRPGAALAIYRFVVTAWRSHFPPTSWVSRLIFWRASS